MRENKNSVSYLSACLSLEEEYHFILNCNFNSKLGKFFKSKIYYWKTPSFLYFFISKTPAIVENLFNKDHWYSLIWNANFFSFAFVHLLSIYLQHDLLSFWNREFESLCLSFSLSRFIWYTCTCLHKACWYWLPIESVYISFKHNNLWSHQMIVKQTYKWIKLGWNLYKKITFISGNVIHQWESIKVTRCTV